MFATLNPCSEISTDKVIARQHNQRKLAKHILDSLNGNGFNAIIAGGAVRDWYYGRTATDLDIFIAGKPKPEHIVALFGVGIRPLSEKEYEKSGFEGFECDMGEETVQFLFHDVEDPRELPRKFPMSISQCWWDGEEYWFSDWFTIGSRYRALIHTEGGFNDSYFCKIMDKFPGWLACASIDSFFKSRFKPARRLHVPEPRFDWEGGIQVDVGEIDF